MIVPHRFPIQLHKVDAEFGQFFCRPPYRQAGSENPNLIDRWNLLVLSIHKEGFQHLFQLHEQHFFSQAGRVSFAHAVLQVVILIHKQSANGGAVDAEHDREQFLKIAKEEIAAFHEGNFARYRLRPSEFNGWQNERSDLMKHAERA